MSKIGKWKRSEAVTGLMAVTQSNSLRPYYLHDNDDTLIVSVHHTHHYHSGTGAEAWKVTAYVGKGQERKNLTAKKTFPWERGNPPRELVAEMKTFAEKFYEAMVHKVQEESKTP